MLIVAVTGTTHITDDLSGEMLLAEEGLCSPCSSPCFPSHTHFTPMVPWNECGTWIFSHVTYLITVQVVPQQPWNPFLQVPSWVCVLCKQEFTADSPSTLHSIPCRTRLQLVPRSCYLLYLVLHHLLPLCCSQVISVCSSYFLR